MKKIFTLFFLVMFVIGTDTFLISPLLPTLTKIYGIPTSISGWMVSAYALGYAFFALISGPISDGLNRKKVMVVGLIAFSISTLLCGIAPSFGAMIICRLLAGISASFVTPQVWASIPILVSSKNIVKAMGYASAGLSISQLVGLPIGSYLASFTWHIPFLVIAGCALLLTLIVILVLPNITTSSINGSRPRLQSISKIYLNLLKTPRAIPYILGYFVFQIGNFGTFTFIGSWLTKDFHLLVGGVGTAMIAIGLGNTIGSLFGNKLTNSLGEVKSFFIYFLLLIILYCILPFSANLLMAEIMLLIIFIVNGCIFPVFMTFLQSLTSTARGTVSALSNAAMYGGTTVGSIIGGILFSRFAGFYGVAFFTAIVYVISLLIYYNRGALKAPIQENVNS